MLLATERCRYERSRSVPINTTLYHVNCHAVMPEDPCFRIMYTADKTQLTITLVEPDRAPEALGNAAEGFITDYIKWVHMASTGLAAVLLDYRIMSTCRHPVAGWAGGFATRTAAF